MAVTQIVEMSSGSELRNWIGRFRRCAEGLPRANHAHSAHQSGYSRYRHPPRGLPI